MPRVDIFCDGSVTSSLLTSPMTSTVGQQHIGRGMVLIPQLDYGLIVQTTEGMVTAAGDPKSDAAEAFAISLALSSAEQLGLDNFRVCSDCQGPISKLGDPRVEWHSREELRLPNDFFDKVLRRASYLRRTDGKVNRQALQAHQIEIFELFNAVRAEFKLSASPLWARVHSDAIKRHPETLGLA